MDRSTTSPASNEATQTEKKSYTTPTLTDFGSFTEITQGTFAGVGADSGIYS
jgi:hypothetical protein